MEEIEKVNLFTDHLEYFPSLMRAKHDFFNIEDADIIHVRFQIEYFCY